MARHESELQTVVPVELGDGVSPYAHDPAFRQTADTLVRDFAGKYLIETPKYYAEARIDPLTGIGNLRAFKEHLQNALDTATPDNRVAVMYLDMDGLKRLNLALGHAGGDELLKMAANGFRSDKNRGEDPWFRIGGDEFTVILEGVRGNDNQTAEMAARRIANRQENRMNAKIAEEDSWDELHVGVSIGVAINEPGDTVETVTERSEADMNVNKEARRKYLEERGIVFGDNRMIVDDPLLDARRTREEWERNAIVDDYGTVVS